MNKYKRLTILHSNDMHGDFLAEQDNEKLTGGVSMLSGYVNKVRREEPNTLYCIAGDMLRGSVIDSEFKGTSTIELMNAIAPDVVSVGNHEVDYGIGHLLFLEKCARFPIINANLYVKSSTSRLFKSHMIREIDGMKILFIGIITEKVMRQVKNEEFVGNFLDIHEAITEVGRICDTYNAVDVDLTVLLTHIGFEEDKKLAALLDPSWGVDVIIGGHSHTYLDKPEIVNGVVIVQAGVGTDQIGRFDMIIDTDNNCLQEYTWKCIPINKDNCPRDEAIDKLLHIYKNMTDQKYNRTVTRLRRELTHSGYGKETELGDLFSDILQESLGLELMFLSSSSIRSETLGTLVHYADLAECFPYDESIRMLTVTGRQLKRMLVYMLRDEIWERPDCTIFQLSQGIEIVYDIPSKKLHRMSFRGAELEDDRLYRIGLQKFQYNNFQKYFDVPLQEIEAVYPSKTIAVSSRAIIEEYLSCHQNLDKKTDGRITLLM